MKGGKGGGAVTESWLLPPHSACGPTLPGGQISIALLSSPHSRHCPPCIPGAALHQARPGAPPAPRSLGPKTGRESRPAWAMSAEPELIELRELAPERRTGLGRTRLERTNALRIAPGTARNTTRQLVPGRGHRFQPAGPATHTWCDLCGDFIWGVVRKGLQCAHCKFTCHYRCRALVCLDCCGPRDLGWEPALEQDTNVTLGTRELAGGTVMGEADAGTPSFEMTWSSTTSSGYCSQEDSDSELEQYFTARTSLARKPRRDQDESVEWETADLSQAEIEQKIKEYNGQINSNLFMSLNKDGSYTGFIKVQLKLVRPVSVPSSKKPPSLQDARRGPGRGTVVKRRTSFYLPKDAVKHLHVLSRTQAREVIEALLRKFMVVDDPRKFALFERAERHGQVYLRKLSDDEQPLRLRLLAGPSEKTLSFILKENDSGEVNWDAFSVPELHNFLRILQREEEEHLRQILQKYSFCRQKIQEALHACPLG
ncbi:Ras association domain-containing protein 1 [Galemys pyrenaicus]|uniref:Ras association domain-containing protein 1 n=1 Tax=Galemys pyrenaicus TaxID=202257 RepID=A0A8J6DYB5_GALPY|nr:Ras association domain-containing protein 1 [Galemys pyrenaicus]